MHDHGGHMHGRKVTEELQSEGNHRNYFFDVFFKIKATIEEAGPAGALSSLHKVNTLFK